MAGAACVLEIMGPPGSGKSTLARRLTDMPHATVVKDHGVGDLPALLRGVLGGLPALGTRPPEGVSLLRWAAWAGRVTAARDVVHRRVTTGARLVLLDQGPAYTLGRMTSVRRSGAGAAWWEHSVQSCAGVLDAVALLDADPATLMHRVRSRPKSHRAKGLAPDAAVSMLLAERQRCRAMADQLAGRGVVVVRLDTSRLDLEVQVEKLDDVLRPRATER